MATRTRGGVLLPIIVIVVAVAVFGGEKVVDKITGFAARALDGGSEIVGEGDSRLLVKRDAKPLVERCDVQLMVAERSCGDLRILLVNARKMPFIARNTKLAWESGHPAVLTANRAKQESNRAAACPRSFPKPNGGQCDEYPMASTDEGGRGARAEEVPARENQCQGPSYRDQYPKDGDKFLVVILFPDNVASTPFTGSDIARDQGWC